jgi:hypothetical protein
MTLNCLKKTLGTKPKTPIPPAVLREAVGIAYGLYSMNAGYAKWYAFNHNDKEITYGEFLGGSEENRLPEFDCSLELRRQI